MDRKMDGWINNSISVTSLIILKRLKIHLDRNIVITTTTIYWALTLRQTPGQTLCSTMPHLILTAMAMRLELLWQVGKLRLWEIQWATQENSATEQQIWAVTILCTPACAWAATGPAVDIGIQRIRGKMLCLQTSAVVHPPSLVFAGILRD